MRVQKTTFAVFFGNRGFFPVAAGQRAPGDGQDA